MGKLYLFTWVSGIRVVSVLEDSGAEGPGFKSQPQRCRVTVLAFPMLKYKYIFQIKYTKAILSNSTLFRFEISKMPIAL